MKPFIYDFTPTSGIFILEKARKFLILGQNTYKPFIREVTRSEIKNNRTWTDYVRFSTCTCPEPSA